MTLRKQVTNWCPSSILAMTGTVLVGFACTLLVLSLMQNSTSAVPLAAATMAQRLAGTTSPSPPPDLVMRDDIKPTIDGAVTPDKIPDETAQLALLRAVWPGNDDQRAKRAKSFMLELFKLSGTRGNSKIVDELSDVVRLHYRRVEVNEQRIRDYRGLGNSGQAAESEAYRRRLLSEFTQDMATRLGPDGPIRMKAVLDRIKARTRVFGN